MTLAIAHEEQGRAVLDLIREVRPPFAPSEVVADFAALLKAYGVLRVVDDRYGGEWPREQFRSHGITYEPADRTKSDLYKEVLPLLNSGRGPDPGRQRDFTGDQDLGRGGLLSEDPDEAQRRAKETVEEAIAEHGYFWP